MALEERDSKTSAEILAEETGRDIEEFELSEGIEIPDLDDLEEHDADEFYSDS